MVAWIAFGLGLAGQSGLPAVPIHTSYAESAPLAIKSAAVIDSAPRVDGVVDIDVDLTATYDNPFDPDDVRLDARATSPTGEVYDVPGFMYRPFDRSLVGGKERLTAAGKPAWRVRICPRQAGAYRVDLTLRDRTGTASGSTTFIAEAAKGGEGGFVRVSQRDRRYFELDSGTAYYPIGANVCWSVYRGTYDYDDWWKSLVGGGANFARIWLGPGADTFAVEQPGAAMDGGGPWQFDLGNAWRLDRELAAANALGLRLMVCFDSFNELRDKDPFPDWEHCVWNRANGGSLRRPEDFWIDPATKRGYRNKLRYLVARYSAFESVMAWELWNEVDLTSGFDASTIVDWHASMAKVLKSLDPYKHPISTSCANSNGLRSLDELADMDFATTHRYGGSDIATSVANLQVRKAEYGKPHLLTEIGADSDGPQAQADPTGIGVHDPMWTAIATGSSGGSMSWWWDSLLAENRLFGIYKPAAAFVAGIDWPGENFRTVWPKVAFATTPNAKERKDVEIDGGPITWDSSNVNRATTVRVSKTGVSAPNRVSGILHGIGNHPNLHNPLTILLDSPVATRFEVEVGDVSGYGGAALRATLDGATKLDQSFVDSGPNPEHNSLTRFAGIYGFDVSAGFHTIVVDNTGADWLMASYRFKNVAVKTAPKIVAWGIVGNDVALAWCRVEDRSWRRICVLKQKVDPVEKSIVELQGLASGEWRVEIWDTWQGRIVDSWNQKIGFDGRARVRLPGFDTDLAVKLVKLGGS